MTKGANRAYPAVVWKVPCQAMKRDKSGPCNRWACRGGWVCNSHGGRAPQVKRAAMIRILEAYVALQLERRIARHGLKRFTP
jgi:hypothetical protein